MDGFRRSIHDPCNRHANSHSFRVKIEQWPHLKSSIVVRKLPQSRSKRLLAPISTSFIYIIEQKIEKNSYFQISLNQLPHLRLAALANILSLIVKHRREGAAITLQIRSAACKPRPFYSQHNPNPKCVNSTNLPSSLSTLKTVVDAC